MMENQQATKITLGWFVGILEGEGCFIGKRLKDKNYTQLCQVRIANTEYDVIESCVAFILDKMILSYITTSKRVNHKTIYELCINGEQDCKNLYDLIKINMECRLNELEQILGASTTTREEPLPDLNWLIGIMEAEGCFTINTQNHKNGCVSHNPAIIIENTNKKIIHKITKTLYTLGIPWYTRDREFQNPNWKSSQVITITGCKRVIRFLNQTKDMWVGSKTSRKARLLYEFCESRLNKLPKAKYSDREHEIAQQVKVKI